MSSKVIRLSPSQLSMYLKCPRQWAFRYVEGLKVPPSGAMKQSGVFHTTAERNYRQKATTLTDLPLDEQTDFFRDTWRDELEREEVVFDGEDSASSLEAQGIRVVQTHHTVIAPTVVPLNENAVEQKFDLSLRSRSTGVEYQIGGRIDLTDKDYVIRDNKALGRAPSQDDVDKDIQLSTYAYARIKNGLPMRAVGLDVVVKNTHPKAVTILSERTTEQLKLHANLMGHVARGIENEVFPPNPTGWWCSKRFCGYWDRCMGKGMKTVDMGQNLEQQLKDSINERARENDNG